MPAVAWWGITFLVGGAGFWLGGKGAKNAADGVSDVVTSTGDAAEDVITASGEQVAKIVALGSVGVLIYGLVK